MVFPITFNYAMSSTYYQVPEKIVGKYYLKPSLMVLLYLSSLDQSSFVIQFHGSNYMLERHPKNVRPWTCLVEDSVIQTGLFELENQVC